MSVNWGFHLFGSCWAVTMLESNKGADNDGANNNINPDLATREWGLRAINEAFHDVWRGRMTWPPRGCVLGKQSDWGWQCLGPVWRNVCCHDRVLSRGDQWAIRITCLVCTPPSRAHYQCQPGHFYKVVMQSAHHVLYSSRRDWIIF